jgi:hypothetical protein
LVWLSFFWSSPSFACCGRVADPYGLSDEAGVTLRHLHPGRETPLDVQMREGRGKNHQAYLWQYSRPRGSVVFDFRLGRGRDGPKQFLGQFECPLQTDGDAACDQIGGPKSFMRSAGRMRSDICLRRAAKSERSSGDADRGADR